MSPNAAIMPAFQDKQYSSFSDEKECLDSLSDLIDDDLRRLLYS